MLEQLKKEVYEANMELPKRGLITYTWGNVSGIDRESGLFVIKPSGVDYDKLSPEDMVVMDLDGNRVEGDLNPSSDTPTHIELYKAFKDLGGIVHTHSPWATSWAQAGRSIPCYGTTHADYFYGEIPCARSLTKEEIEEAYEKNTGLVIIETFKDKNPVYVPGVLCTNHGPFTWGADAAEAVHNAVVLEEVAKMAYRCEHLNPEAKPAPQYLQDKHFFKRQNGVCLFELQNDEIKVITSNLGCHILSVFTKDRDGNYGDVVLGYQDVEDCHKDDKFLGCIIGRVANRIANGEFQLNGKTYKLAVNSGPNTLHGGINGFNQKIFNYEILEDGIRFIYLSPDMEEGFPGSLCLKIVYRLSGNELKMEYEAMTDQDTLINIANHSYFNLSAKDSKIYDHQLMIKSDQIACADENGLPTGEFLDVENTPFDFKSFHEIGERIHDDDEQLRFVGGYDHCFMLKDEKNQAVLYDKESGRKLTITTTLPCMQLYAGNFLAGGSDGKFGKPYENRDGVALEPQFLPNSMNIEKKPRVILRKGEEYEAVTTYRFETE